MENKEELARAALLAANPDSDLIVISHGINRALYSGLSEKLGPIKRNRSRALVFLNTFGGDAHAAFRIARCLRFHYRHVRLIIPHLCKSAGTLIAIGADTIAIGDLGELGPLDVQISNRKEIFERSSGLDFTEALRAINDQVNAVFRNSLIEIRAGAGISTKMAGEFAAELASAAVGPIAAQIDPIQVGEVYRAMKIAHEYGDRLNHQARQLRNGALMQLVNGYPDHSFVIDRKEAENLFKSVEQLTTFEQEFANTVWPLFRTEADCYWVFDSASSPQGESNEGIDEHAGSQQDDASSASIGGEPAGGRVPSFGEENCDERPGGEVAGHDQGPGPDEHGTA